MCDEFGAERLVMAIDSRGGRVAIHGWKTITEITPAEMMQALEPYCSAFLYTHIDTEGLLQGIPMDVVRELARADIAAAHCGRRDSQPAGDRRAGCDGRGRRGRDGDLFGTVGSLTKWDVSVPRRFTAFASACPEAALRAGGIRAGGVGCAHNRKSEFDFQSMRRDVAGRDGAAVDSYGIAHDGQSQSHAAGGGSARVVDADRRA